jgi:hypothetical protein
MHGRKFLGYHEATIRREHKRKWPKGKGGTKTMNVEKILHAQLQIEEHEPHKNREKLDALLG